MLGAALGVVLLNRMPIAAALIGGAVFLWHRSPSATATVSNSTLHDCYELARRMSSACDGPARGHSQLALRLDSAATRCIIKSRAPKAGASMTAVVECRRATPQTPANAARWQRLATAGMTLPPDRFADSERSSAAREPNAVGSCPRWPASTTA